MLDSCMGLAIQSTLEKGVIHGGHFDPRQFPTSSAAAVAWFREHLS